MVREMGDLALAALELADVGVEHQRLVVRGPVLVDEDVAVAAHHALVDQMRLAMAHQPVHQLRIGVEHADRIVEIGIELGLDDLVVMRADHGPLRHLG